MRKLRLRKVAARSKEAEQENKGRVLLPQLSLTLLCREHPHYSPSCHDLSFHVSRTMSTLMRGPCHIHL